MIQEQSSMLVSDNSGAKAVTCIKVLGHSKKRYARVGDLVKVAVKGAIPQGKVKSGEVHNAIVVRTRATIQRPDGLAIRFDENACVLLTKGKDALIGTRVFGSVTRELRVAAARNKSLLEVYSKILSLAPEVL